MYLTTPIFPLASTLQPIPKPSLPCACFFADRGVSFRAAPRDALRGVSFRAVPRDGFREDCGVFVLVGRLAEPGRELRTLDDGREGIDVRGVDVVLVVERRGVRSPRVLVEGVDGVVVICAACSSVKSWQNLGRTKSP